MTPTLSRTARPVLLSPTAARPADALHTTFSWRAEPARDTRLQVSTSRHFDTLVCDVPTRGLTQLTLDRVLPRLGQTYYWRVGTDGAWSAPAAFVGATDEDVQQWEWARHEEQLRQHNDARRIAEAGGTGRATPAVIREEMEAPFQVSSTSRTEALLWTYLIIVGFAAVVVLVVRAAA